MKKQIIIIGLITLLLISCVNAITQTELETYTNNNIQTYLIQNLINKGTQQKENNVIFYFQTKTIKKFNINDYRLYNKFISINIPIEHIKYCIQNYNLEICKTNLIYNFGTYNLNNNSYPTVYEQLKTKIFAERDKIIYYRDNKEDINELIGDFTI